MPYKKGICRYCGKPTSSIKYNRCSNCRKEDDRTEENKQDYKRNWYRLKKYNLSPMEFEVFWIAFKGKCGICNIELINPVQSRGQPDNVVVIDHDHKTGKIRGLLCGSCNKGLGLFKDNKESLIKAIMWIS